MGSGCLFAIVPAVLVGVLVAVAAIVVRDDQAEDGPGARIEGPAAELPAVGEALTVLADRVPAPDERAEALGVAVGEIGRALIETDDELAFAESFDVLPVDGAELLGEALGAVQREVSPGELGGPRRGGDRTADMAFALELVWAAAPVLDPDSSPDEQALNVLPAAVPLADTGDAIVAAVVAADFDEAAELLDPVLSDAGAAEIVSGLAGDLSDRIGPRDDDRLDAFQDAYNLELP